MRRPHRKGKSRRNRMRLEEEKGQVKIHFSSATHSLWVSPEYEEGEDKGGLPGRPSFPQMGLPETPSGSPMGSTVLLGDQALEEVVISPPMCQAIS